MLTSTRRSLSLRVTVTLSCRPSAFATGEAGGAQLSNASPITTRAQVVMQFRIKGSLAVRRATIALPPQSQSDSHLPFAPEILGVGDDRVTVQIAHRSVRVEKHVGDVRIVRAAAGGRVLESG